MKPHVLSVPEERLFALGSVALSGYDDTFSQLTDVDMKFGVLIDETGREKPLTQSSFSSFLVKRDPELRKSRFPSILRGISRPSVYACRVACLFSQGGCVSCQSKTLSICARGGAVSR